jgi:starch-binding outer membrane protein, SusD/RagB family
MRESIGTLMSVVVLASCDLHVPDLNDQGLADLRDRPTPVKVAAASVGLLIGARADIAPLLGYVNILGVLGREAYDFDAADPRPITELLVAETLDPANPFSGAIWAVPYRNIRNANVLQGAVDAVVAMTPAEKEATRGFAKTITASDYLRIIDTRDDLGAVIARSPDLHTLDPIVGKAEVFAYIATLLDEGKTHLMAGGDTFPFALGTGFSGFDTPATFLRVNRALAGRVEVYRKNYPLALAALGESFLSADPATPRLELGVYHAYGTGSGDLTNALVSPNLFAHPSIVAGAEMTASGQPDARVTRKLKMVMARTTNMLTSDRAFTIYSSPTSPVAIIRNEELILLRAEANIGMGNLTAAIDDLNFIRVNSGSLPPRTDLDAGNIVDELLKQRLYSLLFEGGHRWIDMRRHGRLDQLPLDLPTHHLHANMPIPLEETDARQ